MLKVFIFILNDRCLESKRRRDPDQSLFLQDLLLATMTLGDLSI